MCEFRLFSVRLYQHSQSPSEGCNTESVLFVCFSLHGGKTQRGCDKVWLTKLPLGKVTQVATDLTRSVVARKSVSTFSTWQTACSLFCLFFTTEIPPECPIILRQMRGQTRFMAAACYRSSSSSSVMTRRWPASCASLNDILILMICID